MRVTTIVFRLTAILLLAGVLNSCVFHAWFEQPKEDPPQFKGRVLQLIPASEENGRIYMTDISFEGNTLRGTVFRGGSEPYARDTQLIKVYLPLQTALPDSLPAEFDLPLSQVERLEVYDVDLGKSVFVSVLTGLGIAATTYFIAILVILATKGSCPFVYALNGGEFEFTGEIYSGAVLPSLEREDWLALPGIRPQDGQYRLKLANQAEEIQYTNLAELWVVDHPLGTELLVDRDGNFHTISQALVPRSARSLLGDDVLELVRAKDEAKYLGDNTLNTERRKEGIELSFSKPAKAKTAVLALRARNSIWLDYTIGEMFDLMGGSYDQWYETQQGRGLAPQWIEDQGIPLAVYVKRGGAWELAARVPVIGPMADRDVAVPLNLAGVPGEELELKLEGGARFWEIDYVGLDYSPGQPYHQKTVPLASAIDQDGKDARKALAKSDKAYFTQPRVGDAALLCFNSPQGREGWARSVFLHNQGHYKIIRKSRGLPDLAKLGSIREPGGLGEFSREKFLEINPGSR